MRKCVFTLVGAAVVWLVVTPAVLGCGDKFVVLGRGVRFQAVHLSEHPASILIYMGPTSKIPAADREFQLQTMLKLAGHKPAAVTDSNDLEKALRSGQYDLVLVDLSDVGMLERETKGTTSKPEILPVVYNPSGKELADAEKRYSCVVKASKKSHDLLAVIDEAMSGKIKGTGANCRK